METDLIPNVRGNVQSLRNLWSEKARAEQTLTTSNTVCFPTQRKISVPNTPSDIKRKPTVTFNTEGKSVDHQIKESSSAIESQPTTDDINPPSDVLYNEQTDTSQASVEKISDVTPDKKPHFTRMKNNGVRHWHIARHVFRSGLIFNSSRRASDSIVPLLIKTHIAHYRSHTDSLDSTQNESPFENLIDYLTYDKIKASSEKPLIKRTISDSTACLQRNKLSETITQYETIMHHLKNYDRFIVTHRVPSPKPPVRKFSTIQSTEEKIPSQPIVVTRKTQSLARNAGRAFSDFIMNDLLLPPTVSRAPQPTVVHTTGQTNDAFSLEETKVALNELDKAIESTPEEIPFTANSEIKVIVVNSPSTNVPVEETPLMQRLFEGKKSAYKPEDLSMEATRIPEELVVTFEIAKRKCFFSTEEVIYASKMIKIDRRGYKQHLRLLCLTTERLYIVMKKNPYPKEGVTFDNILGISCTPYQDGFVCVHTNETREDRGDWIFLVDHPCEFITQVFLALKRTNNDDQFLKIKSKFTHTRRSIATLADDGQIEARLADSFRIEGGKHGELVINTP